ncbi:MAG: response regulator [Longimicrobiales bacterium]
MASNPDKPRVLFVEDAFDQAILVKAFLSGDYEVVHCQDGDQAVHLLRSQQWDILITDLNLPGTDGFDVIRESRTLNPAMPVLATTGYTGSAYQEQAFRAGATELMTKPLHRDDFTAKVRELLGQRVAVAGGTILAIGGLVGDVEMGCGGTLLAARAEGRRVVIVPLCSDERDPDGRGLDGARRAADILQSQVTLDAGAMEHTTGRVALLEQVVAELAPAEAYLPAMDDRHPSRMEAFRIAKAATSRVRDVYGYQTSTTGLDFKPDRYVEVGEQMVMKMESLAAYQAAGAGRLDLAPRMAQAYARYWGRFHNFTEVEAFETLRGNS